MKTLKRLVVNKMGRLKSIKGISNSNIEYLIIGNTDNLKDLKGIETIRTLKWLETEGNYDLKGIGNLNIEHLEIVNNDLIKNLYDVKTLKSLKTLSLRRNKALGNLEGIENLLLDTLTITMYSLHSLVIIKKINLLKCLVIDGSFNLERLDILSDMQSLVSLEIDPTDSLMNLNSLKNFKYIKSLTLNFENDIKSLEGLEKMSSLKILHIHYGFLGGGIKKNIDALYNLHNLQELYIPESMEINDSVLAANNKNIKIIRKN